MDTATLILEYLKVLLSGPVVAGGVVLIVTAKFKKDIQALLARKFRVRFPGGEFEASQLEREASSAETGPAENEARLWEYRYLNLYLVRGTQLVLDWFATLASPMSPELYDTFLTPWVPDVREREAIRHALETHHLVGRTEGGLVITSKGRDYRNWRGPLLPLTPTPATSGGSTPYVPPPPPPPPKVPPPPPPP